MSRRVRQIMRDQKSRKMSQDIADVLGGSIDPEIAMVATDPGGEEEAIAELLASARRNGCTCQEPEFHKQQLENRVYRLLMVHDDECPLIRVLEEGRA